MTAEHPIIMCSESVSATPADRKTQTRRVIKPQPKIVFDSNVVFKVEGKSGGQIWSATAFDIDRPRTYTIKCPYGKVGDLLWVRESWDFRPMGKPLSTNRIVIIGYKADGTTRAKEVPQESNPTVRKGWRPSIHMPKWAARLWLEITNIRVERVRSISESDIIYEGCPEFESLHLIDELCDARFQWFQTLWDSLNAKRGYGWDKNPYVWVIEYK